MDDWRVTVPSMSVDDVHFVQPVGFVWFSKPRYRIKCGRRVW
jgi:hypothetical protein